MATISEIKELALHAAKGTAPANFTNENVDEALRGELNKMCSSIMEFKKNEYDIFTIIAETSDEVVPKKVMDRMGMFAEFRTVPDGQKTVFHRATGKQRARAFITRVGLGGVYEAFRLDSTEFEVPVHAVGSATMIDFERMLDGSENMSDLMDIVLEGLEDAAYIEVAQCLMASVGNAKRPANNEVIVSTFDSAKLQKLITNVKRYDDSAVLFACDEFIDEMGPDAIVPGTAAFQGIYSPDDIEAIHNNGRVKIFRGTPIVEMPNSWTGPDNQKTWVNPQYAYVLPTGREKVVKFVFEGGLQMWENQNKDRSMEIEFYQKMGAAIITYNNWGLYKNSHITDSSENPYNI